MRAVAGASGLRVRFRRAGAVMVSGVRLGWPCGPLTPFRSNCLGSFRASPPAHCTHGSSANALASGLHCMPTPQTARAYARTGALPLHFVELRSKDFHKLWHPRVFPSAVETLAVP